MGQLAEIIGSAVIDGPDKVGKKIASLATLESLLDAGTISVNGAVLYENDWSVLYTDYPEYFTPSGHLVRAMNRGGASEFGKFINSVEGVWNLEDELHLRMAMYAMDRLFSWVLIHSERLKTTKKLIHISDRSIYSNIVTMAYLLQSYKVENQFDRYYPDVLSADKALSEAWDWNLVTLSSNQKGSISSNREGESDELESASKQPFIEKCYERLSGDPNYGSRVVVVKDASGKWKTQEEEAREILEKVGITVLTKRTPVLFEVPGESLFDKMAKRYGRGSVFYIRPSAIIKTLFPYFRIGESDHEALYRNFKLNEYLWRVAYMGDAHMYKGTHALVGKERKEALAHLEAKLARIMAVVMAKSYADDNVIKSLPPELISAGNFLLNSYTNGRLLSFIRFLESKEHMPPGWSRFVSQVFMS